ncbi:hypothetical protein EDD15DRAFT_2368793 [Pisolithus albus]|nr:hypothetical protein EDD15DRAFT_2368793 [Pisolithus albus]
MENLGRQTDFLYHDIGSDADGLIIVVVFIRVADLTGYENNGLTGDSTLPLLNLTGTIPGPLNPGYSVPCIAPNTSGVGGGNGSTYVAPDMNMSLSASSTPSRVNLTASSTY